MWNSKNPLLKSKITRCEEGGKCDISLGDNSRNRKGPKMTEMMDLSGKN